MNEASKELCEELYKLTGWADSSMYVVDWPDGKRFPRYDLGFLIRKLPNFLEYWDGGNECSYLKLTHWSRDWECGYWDDAVTDNRLSSHYCDTPENAACQLLVELVKRGVIKRED